MQVLSTVEDDGVATMTISIADDDYKFDVWADGSTALVKHQETLSWRGRVRVTEPDDDVYKALMVSDKMTDLLDEWGVSSVKRAEPQH
jgi:hypothetical protein